MNPQALNPRSGFGLQLAPGERQDLGNGRYCYRNPGGLAAQNLGTDDWVLILRSSTTAPMAWADPKWNRLELWPNRTGREGTARLEGRIYAADGSPVGGSFVVSGSEGWLPRKPTVGRDGAGNFIAVWESRTEPEGPSILRVWRGSQNGGALGPIQDLKGGGTDMLAPSVSADGVKRFLVAWHERTLEDGASRVMLQRFDSSGFEDGPPFEVGGKEAEEAASPKVACDLDGDCLVAWVGHDLSTGDSTLRAQRLDKSWTPTGSELEVWTAPAGGIRLQWVSATQLGVYELSWEEANEEGESLGGFRTLLDVDGKTLVEPELVQAPFAACVTPPSPCTL
jgi:hypothetical protein